LYWTVQSSVRSASEYDEGNLVVPLSNTGPTPPELVGRENELARIDTFLADAATTGAALVLSGAPGIGKTVLLDAAESTATASGMRVLRATGAEFETDLSFAGLHHLWLPLLSATNGLSTTQTQALRIALGFGAGPRPDGSVVCDATLALLQHAALTQPVLVITDDLQWLDRDSLAVLSYLAGHAVPGVGLLSAMRSGPDSLMGHVQMPNHVLQPISEDSAAALLDSRFPALTPHVRRRLISEAEGNPLALEELPTVLSAPQFEATEAMPEVLPLTARLRALFAARITGLPLRTLRLLLLAALGGVNDLRVLQAAADTSQLLDDLAPAGQARLISVDGHNRRVDFCHSLIRSSVVELSTASERRDAHRALAGALLHQPDRHAWHLADASLGPDELVAVLLDQVARRMFHRGDIAAAVRASTRAAALSETAANRVRRLAEAAYLCARLGQPNTASQLFDTAHQADPGFTGSLRAASIAAYLLIGCQGDVDTAHRLLVAALSTYQEPWVGENRVLTEAMNALNIVCTLSGGGPECWQPFHDAVARLGPHSPVELVLRSEVFADPARATAASLARLDDVLAGLCDETDLTKVVRISIVTVFVDRRTACREALTRVVQQLRGVGCMESDALCVLGLDGFFAGLWDDAESIVLAVTHGSELLIWPSRYVLALLAAARGDVDTNRRLFDELTNWAAPRGARLVQRSALHARALAAIGQGDFDHAYQLLTAIARQGNSRRTSAPRCSCVWTSLRPLCARTVSTMPTRMWRPCARKVSRQYRRDSHFWWPDRLPWPPRTMSPRSFSSKRSPFLRLICGRSIVHACNSPTVNISGGSVRSRHRGPNSPKRWRSSSGSAPSLGRHGPVGSFRRPD
jgi:hypothetical protein